MISCDECQKKLVAAFDHEAGKGDEQSISSHLKDCRQCRTFYQDMVRFRQQFVSVPMPGLPPAVGQKLMRIAQADSLRDDRRGYDKNTSRQPLLVRFPRLRWAGGLAAALLLVSSWLACYAQTKRVVDLKQQLQASRQELAVARQDLAVARAEEQRKEDRDREQKAITALYLRMAELEERVERFSSPRMAFFQRD
jgi:predicted anti-sigma-YlaC factor YlaD